MNGGIGRYVRARREALGLTQARLEELTGLNQKRISQIEGHSEEGYLPPLQNLRALAPALQCRVSDLVEAAGFRNGDDRPPLDDPEVLFFASARRQLTADDIAVVHSVIEGLRRARLDEPKVRTS